MADAINAPEKEPKEKKSEFEEGTILPPDQQSKEFGDGIKAEDFKPGKVKGMPSALKVVQFLLLLGAAFSIIGSISLFQVDSIGGMLAIISAAASLLIVWGINKRVAWAYWLLIALIVYSVITTFINWTWGSIFSLIIDAIILYYVTQSKSWFKDNKQI